MNSMSSNAIQRPLVVLILAVVGALCAPIARGDEARLQLVARGKSDYTIVIDPGALETPKFAAKELQTYIEKATGVHLPIVDKLPASKKGIVVGPGASAQALGVSLDGVQPEGFLVRTVGDAIVIVGRDTPGHPMNLHWKSSPQAGTLFGVYAFLERQLGIRWYMPGEIGEIIPKTDAITLGNIDIHEAPSYVNRTIFFQGYEEGKKEGMLWLRRNRVGHSLSLCAWHNWWTIIPCDPSPRDWPSWLEPKQPYRDHPEYYALVNGRRLMSHHGDHMGGEVCTTNPDVIRIFADSIIEHFRKHPDDQMFSLTWNDGGNFCECERCRALDSETDANGRPIVADRLLTFYNAVGRLVAEKFPDKFLGASIYYGSDLPRHVTAVERNVYLQNPYNEASTLFFNADYRRKSYDQMRSWCRLCDHMTFYTAYHGGGLWSFPYSSTPVLADLFPFLKESGVKIVTFYGVEGWGGNALDMYLACRLSWDSSLDARSIANEFYDRFYGAQSGRSIRAFHELLQKAVGSLAGHTKITDIGTLDDAGVKMIEPIYAPIRQEGRRLIDAALHDAPDERIRQRVQLVSDSWRLVELTLDALATYTVAEKSPTQSNAAGFKQAVDAREKFLEEQKDSLAIAYREVRSCDERYQFPGRPAIAEHLLAQKGTRKLAECRKTLQPPRLDGRIGDETWKSAAVLDDFGTNALGEPVRFATQGRLLYDDKNLYIAIDCHDPDPAHLLGAEKKRDGKIWEDNDVEIFLDPGRDGKRVYQFLVNHLGSLGDQKIENGKGNFAWNAAVEVKTAMRGDGWSLEMVIPWADLGEGVPVPGDLWRFNICRVRRNSADMAHEYSAYSPTFGLFNRPDRFADVVFK